MKTVCPSIVDLQIRNVGSKKCLVANGDKADVVFYTCTESAENQVFQLTARQEIRNFDQCMDVASTNVTVKTLPCHHSGGNQKWVYNEEVSGQ